MGTIKELLMDLGQKYNNSVPLVQVLELKYSFVMKEDEKDEHLQENPMDSYVVLSDNAEENRQFLNQLIAGIGELTERLDLSDKDTTRVKIIEEYKTQLDKITEKKLESGEKFAGLICKCIKKTILKLFDYKDYGKEIMRYLQVNGFQVDSFKRGHKLSDDDLCDLDETLLQAYRKRTEIPEDNYKVIDMIQPIIKIFYVDDEETCSHVIPGTCTYFVKEVTK